LNSDTNQFSDIFQKIAGYFKIVCTNFTLFKKYYITCSENEVEQHFYLSSNLETLVLTSHLAFMFEKQKDIIQYQVLQQM